MSFNLKKSSDATYIDAAMVRAFHETAMADGADYFVQFHKADGTSRVMLVAATERLAADLFVDGSAPRRDSATAINVVDSDLLDALNAQGADPKGAWRAYNLFRVVEMTR